MITETTTADKLASQTLAASPVAPTSPAPAPSPAAAAPVQTDAIGRPFDGAKFFPRKDSLGRWVHRGVGRKPANGAAPKPTAAKPSPEAPPAGTPTEPQPAGQSFIAPDPAPAAAVASGPDRYDLAADMYCRAFYSMADSILAGKGEWAPDNDAEHEQLRAASAAYMRAKGMEDLPPGPALLLAVATYSAKRIQRPNTATRLRMFVDYWRARFSTWRTGRKIDALPAISQAPTANGTN